MTRQHDFIRGVTFTLGMLLAGVADAAPTGTYVDATPANTTPASGTIRVPYTSDPGDNLWTLREFSGVQGDNVLEADGPGQEDASLLTTTVTGVTPGVYDVYVIYHRNGPGDWGVQAGFPGGPLTEYRSNGTLTGNTSAGGAISEYQAMIGQVTSTGSISVNVDELATNVGGADQRAWYDGISYAPVPEPSAAALGLIALGAGGLPRRRRRRRRA